MGTNPEENAGASAEPVFDGGLPDAAIERLGGHVELVQRLSSMVASELIAAEGLTGAQALMTVAQALLSCAAHTACYAAREHLGRAPEYSNWKGSCDAAFTRAVAKIDALKDNLPGEVNA